MRVFEVISANSLEKMVVRAFREESDYLQEKQCAVCVREKCAGDGQTFVSLVQHMDEKRLLFYEQGMCTLQEVDALFREKHIRWYQIEPIFKRIVSELTDIVVATLENGIYHGNIQPDNVVFYTKHGKMSKHIKLADFSCCTTDYRSLRCKRSPRATSAPLHLALSKARSCVV